MAKVKGYCYCCRKDGKLIQSVFVCARCRQNVCEKHLVIVEQIGLYGKGVETPYCTECRTIMEQQEYIF